MRRSAEDSTTAAGPDFLCIGAEKAGSTWLYQRMREHRQVAATPLKELNYFNAIDLGVDTRLLAQVRGEHWINLMWRRAFRHRFLPDLWRRELSPLRWYLHYFFGRRSDDWYRALFTHGPGEVSGDFTPNYSALSPAGVARVREAVPEALIMLIMRDPIDRAWSAAKMNLSGKPGRPLETVSEREFGEYLSGDRDRALGDYAQMLELWSASFGSDRILAGFYDEIVDDPEGLLRRVCDFLGIGWDPSVAARARTVVNRGSDSRPVPEFAQRLLAEKYEPALERLIDRLDGPQARYPEGWLDRARRIMA
jgi:hypothetical protein